MDINVSCKSTKTLYASYHLVKAMFETSLRYETEGNSLNVTSAVNECQLEEIIVTVYSKNSKNKMIKAGTVKELYVRLKEFTDVELPWGMLTGVRPTKLSTEWILKHAAGNAAGEANTAGVAAAGATAAGEAAAAGNADEDAAAFGKSGDREAFARWIYNERFVSEKKAELAYDISLRELSIMQRIREGQLQAEVISDQLNGRAGTVNQTAAELSARPQKETAGSDQGYEFLEGYSLYVGIPFCPSICSYCSFSSGSVKVYKDRIDAYIDALCREMETAAQRCGYGGIYPTTIYVGGGTPTALSAGQLDRLLSRIDELFIAGQGGQLADGKVCRPLEYTVEAGRPDSITREKLQIIKKHGVSRISVNPQTMQQRTLDLIGRAHTVEQIVDAMHVAREEGFNNINMDLIAGLPGENADDMADTLRQIEELKPESLTVHSLAVKRASLMGMQQSAARAADKKRPQGAVDAENSTSSIQRDTDPVKKAAGSLMVTDAEKSIALAMEAAERMGLLPYYLYRQKSIAGNLENIGYARPGFEGIYNMLIMEEVQSIIACGAGASTKIVFREGIPNPKRHGQITYMQRYENVKNIDEYIKRY